MNLSQRFAVALIHLYQYSRPVLDQLYLAVFGVVSRCRQTPSCSDYTILMIQKHGTIAGLFSGGKRILSCHPL